MLAGQRQLKSLAWLLRANTHFHSLFYLNTNTLSYTHILSITYMFHLTCTHSLSHTYTLSLSQMHMIYNSLNFGFCQSSTVTRHTYSVSHTHTSASFTDTHTLSLKSTYTHTYKNLNLFDFWANTSLHHMAQALRCCLFLIPNIVNNLPMATSKLVLQTHTLSPLKAHNAWSSLGEEMKARNGPSNKPSLILNTKHF